MEVLPPEAEISFGHLGGLVRVRGHYHGNTVQTDVMLCCSFMILFY